MSDELFQTKADYDILHTQGKAYIIETIEDFIKTEGE